MKPLFLLLLIVLAPLPAFSAEQLLKDENIHCYIQTKRWCEKDHCNESSGEGEYITVDFSKNLYKLCTKGKPECQSFPIKNIRHAGAFISIFFGGNSFLKVSTMDESLMFDMREGDFIEIRDLGLGMMSSFGFCKAIKN